MTFAVVNGGWAGVPVSPEDLQETVASLEAQLMTLYEEKEGGGFGGVDTDVVALYEHKVRAATRQLEQHRLMVDSLEAQLRSLYEDRETAPAAPDATESLVQQLHVLYHEKEHSAGHAAMVESLEAQVAVLLEERDELQQRLVTQETEAARALSRAKDMLGSMIDRTLSLG
ncbi:MAG: hypothetical protein NW201_02645 [Gemmatimonadales bacterium]|nr:hypothetical protein [Gemmatimonadales bacterium]